MSSRSFSADISVISYVYVITNLVNAKRYVGKTNRPRVRWYEHRHDAKMGCSLAIHQAIRKHGEDRFTFEIVSEHGSEEEAFLAEVETIKRLESRGLRGYNENDGGRGGYRPSEEARLNLSVARRGWILSDATKLKMSQSHKGVKLSAETRAKLSVARRSRGPITDEARQNMREAQLRRERKPLSEETKAKLSGTWRGRKHSDESRAKMSVARRDRGPLSDEARQNIREGQLRRAPFSEEMRLKLSVAQKGRIVSDETREKLAALQRGRVHGVEERLKVSQANRGRTMSEETRLKMSEGQRMRRLRERDTLNSIEKEI